MIRKKKIIVIPLALIILFGIFNLFWWISVRVTYQPYIEKVPKDESGVYVKYDEREDITYNIKMPDYLHFTGNLGVSDSNGTVMIIWPSLFRRNMEYGVRVQDNQEAYEIYVDEQLNPVSQEEFEKEVIQKNYDKVKRLYDNAKAVWDL